jgi:ankyrin repeat protein
MVKLLHAENGVDPDFKDIDGWTPLPRGTEKGHGAVVKLLLVDGVGVDSNDIYSRTPLLATDAVEWNSEDTLSDPTPLSWAARYEHELMVKLLLSKNRLQGY